MSQSTVPENTTIGFIGAGKMAYSMACGFVKSGLVQTSNIVASCRHPDLSNPFKDLGVMVTGDNKEVVRRSHVVFISVKPHQVVHVLAEITPVASRSNIFVSIAGGITISTIEENLPSNNRVLRVGINIPVEVSSGVAVVAAGSCVEEGDVTLVSALMTSAGSCDEIPETLANAANGVGGSGTAFMFTALEALSDGGVKVGLPRALAIRLAARTMMGAAKMVLETGKHPAQLKDDVCSPGGTTIAGIHKLDKAGFRGALMDAVEAAFERSVELGQKK